MPLVTALQPPVMNVLLYRHRLPPAIDKPRLRRWLTCVYTELYQQPSDDPRIDRMLSSLPESIALL